MHKKTIQLLIILLIGVLCAHLDKVSAKKNSEEIIVINNTGGGGCGGGAKTIVKTDGNKKKKGGHKIILMAGGTGGKSCEKHHHHTRVVHVPVPVPIPVVKHEHPKDHWGGGSSHDDHWASASSTDEIKPKSIKVSSASVPHRASFGAGHMMSRMEKQSNEQKSTLLQSLLNNDKSSRSDKKSNGKNSLNDSKKKNNSEKQKDQLLSTLPQLIHHHLMDHSSTGQELLAPIPFSPNQMMPDAVQQSALINQMQSAAFMNPNFLSPPTPHSMISNDLVQHQPQQSSPEQQQQLQQQQLHQQQLHNAIQQIQMQQQFEQHLQNEHQKMQEALASTQPLPLPQDSLLASQLPIPLPGQSLSAPVFEPINPINQTNQLNSNLNNQQSQTQFNELEIIPYEVQQQLQAAAQFARQFVHDQSLKDQLPMNSNDKEFQGKNKKFEHINKDHPLDESASNSVMEAISILPPPNQQLANLHSQFLHSNSRSNNPHQSPEMMIFDSHPLQQQVHSFMMAQQTIQIPILISAEQPESLQQEEKPTIKRYRI